MKRKYRRENSDYVLEIWHEGTAIYALYKEKPDLISNWKMVRQECSPDDFNSRKVLLEVELTS